MAAKLAIAWGIAAAMLAVTAQAQLFKCKGPDGKVVYSDTRCDAGSTTGALPPGVANRAHENEAKAAAEKAAADKAAAEDKRKAEALVDAAKKAGIAGAPPASAPQEAASDERTPYELTNADRDRIRTLEIDAGRIGAYPEQKIAAQLEMQSIRKGRESRLSSGDRERRESLNADLVSTDAAKRRRALDELRSIYYR